MYVLGIDIGGTFTDFTLIDKATGEIEIGKELTTPDNPAVGALTGARDLLAANDVVFNEVSTIIHGTTLVSNTLIERTGARTGLVTTEGIRDVLEIRRAWRYDVNDWDLTYPDPLVPRAWRLTVDERLDENGDVVRPLDTAEVVDAVERLVEDHGVESIAVSLLHAYASNDHEQKVADVVRERYPSVDVSLSSSVAPVIREYERTSTTVINAYTAPILDEYLDFLLAEFIDAGFENEVYLMTSNGGVVDVDTAKAEAVRLVESGPAAGVLANTRFGAAHGAEDVFSFDMGGTTAKGAVVRDGSVPRTHQTDVAREHRFKEGSGFDITAPMLDLSEIGAGGGSIASTDEFGLVEVGPESAGADPGPVCYDQGGTRPTVTDANLLLGFLNPENFFGGSLSLAVKATEEAIRAHLAEELGITVREAAWRVYENVTENMALAYRRYTSRRGIDPRGLSMVPIGGAGPAHAVRVANKIGIDRVICPYGAGVGSSVGLTAAPRSYEASATHQTLLSELDATTISDRLEPLAEEATAVVTGAGAAPDETVVTPGLDMRHVEQGREIQVSFPGQDIETVTPELARERFRETYRETFDRDVLEHPTEVLTFRVEVSEEKDIVIDWRYEGADAFDPDRREVYFGPDHGAVTADVYDWNRLVPGGTFDGPAIVESDRTTLVATPDTTVRVEGGGNLVVDVV
jgi:N-methylhydantoinase A/oxoprolinase/acetone carboxylase beta subunit